MTDLSHFDESGASRMVDVGQKEITNRVARASALIEMRPETLERIQNRSLKKGDVLEVARIAGILAAKRTSELIPLCHPLALDSVSVSFGFEHPNCVSIVSEVRVTARTGVEMEALVAASTTALTIYDMCKSIDRAMTIKQIQLDEKSGGKSGHFVREEQDVEPGS